MDAERWHGERVYLYRHPVDMRKSIDGLCALIDSELNRNPMDRCLYAFLNRGRDKIKLLIWHRNGYWLLYKRLEKQRFSWPDWFEKCGVRTGLLPRVHRVGRQMGYGVREKPAERGDLDAR